MSRNKRGKEYVDPQVQGALWRRLVVHWLAYTGIALLLVVGLEWMSDPFQSISEVVTRAWWTYSPMLLVLACLIPLFVYDSIRLSHRFAGPVFRLRQVIHSLASGSNPERIEFRDNDFWKEIAADMNQVIDRLGNAPTKNEEPGT
ncbi:HAMP domain-containing protein [Aeoliella sp.]|uniref:HAMP domain-containing protein n=1 Tax=Aeoliella sp. TaxID=2795800 RepID=UPI003CCB9145